MASAAGTIPQTGTTANNNKKNGAGSYTSGNDGAPGHAIGGGGGSAFIKQRELAVQELKKINQAAIEVEFGIPNTEVSQVAAVNGQAAIPGKKGA